MILPVFGVLNHGPSEDSIKPLMEAYAWNGTTTYDRATKDAIPE